MLYSRQDLAALKPGSLLRLHHREERGYKLTSSLCSSLAGFIINQFNKQ